MPTHNGRYVIKASAEDVFRYMDNADNSVKATPSLKDAEVVENNENEKIIEASYSLGKIISGDILLIEDERIEGQKLKFNIQGDIEGYAVWKFENRESDSVFTYQASYELKKISAPSFLVDKVASRIDERNMNSFIKNLRSDLE